MHTHHKDSQHVHAHSVNIDSIEIRETHRNIAESAIHKYAQERIHLARTHTHTYAYTHTLHAHTTYTLI